MDHCHTLSSVKISLAKEPDRVTCVWTQRMRGTSSWVLTRYVGSVLTGNYKSVFLRSFIFSWFKQFLCSDFAADPSLPYPPGTLGKDSVYCCIPSFCHLYGHCLSSCWEDVIWVHVIRAFFLCDKLPTLWPYQSNKPERLVSCSGLDVNNTFLTIRALTAVFHVHSLHTCSNVSSDTSSCRHFHLDLM